MTLSRMPEPDRAVLDRSGAIIKDLEAADRRRGGDLRRGRAARVRDRRADRLPRMPLAVVLPRSTEDVSKVLKYCHQNQLKVVPRGAGTSLSGGALPAEDAIVIGISRMNRVLEVDYDNRTITRRGGHHQSRHHRGGRRRKASSTRPIPRASSPARSAATSP